MNPPADAVIVEFDPHVMAAVVALICALTVLCILLAFIATEKNRLR
jgi:hypothetical protein